MWGGIHMQESGNRNAGKRQVVESVEDWTEGLLWGVPDGKLVMAFVKEWVPCSWTVAQGRVYQFGEMHFEKKRWNRKKNVGTIMRSARDIGYFSVFGEYTLHWVFCWNSFTFAIEITFGPPFPSGSIPRLCMRTQPSQADAVNPNLWSYRQSYLKEKCCELRFSVTAFVC